MFWSIVLHLLFAAGASVYIAQRIVTRRDTNFTASPPTANPSTHAQEGDWALTELRRVHTDVSVVCPAGVSLSHGLSQPSPAAAAVSAAEVAAGARVVALAEGSTLGRPSFVTFAGLDEVDEVVVAGDPAQAALDELVEHGVRCTDRRSAVGQRRGRKS